jgi:hypothetical protein
MQDEIVARNRAIRTRIVAALRADADASIAGLR